MGKTHCIRCLFDDFSRRESLQLDNDLFRLDLPSKEQSQNGRMDIMHQISREMDTCVEVCARSARGGVMLTSMYEGYNPRMPSTAARGIRKEKEDRSVVQRYSRLRPYSSHHRAHKCRASDSSSYQVSNELLNSFVQRRCSIKFINRGAMSRRRIRCIPPKIASRCSSTGSRLPPLLETLHSSSPEKI